MRGSRGDDRDNKTIAVQSDAKNIQCQHWCMLGGLVCQGTREEKTNAGDVVVTKYERISVEQRMKQLSTQRRKSKVKKKEEEKKEWEKRKNKKRSVVYLSESDFRLLESQKKR